MILKTLTIWAAFIPVAIANGLVREKGLSPLMGRRLALQVSGVSGAFLFFLLTYLALPWLGGLKPRQYRMIGISWLIMTVVFECGFGRLAAHKSWREILSAYDPATGNLWILVLLTIATAPYTAAYCRGYLR